MKRWQNQKKRQKRVLWKLDSLRWFPKRRSPTPHFGGAHPGGYDPQIRTRSRFLYNAPTSQVSSSYVYSFGSYRVDKQTNTQTNKQTNRRRWKHHLTLFATLRRWVKTSVRFTPMANCTRPASKQDSLSAWICLEIDAMFYAYSGERWRQHVRDTTDATSSDRKWLHADPRWRRRWSRSGTRRWRAVVVLEIWPPYSHFDVFDHVTAERHFQTMFADLLKCRGVG